IEDREALFVQTPEEINKRFNIDIRVKNEVIGIDRDQKEVDVRNLITNETYKEPYDTLVLATGSSPIKPPIPGIDSPNVFTLWNVHDTDNIKNFIINKQPKEAVVIGGGFIGIETAENLHALGMKVSVIEMLHQVMAPLDFEMSEIVHQNIRAQGVNLHLGDGVSKLDHKDGVTTVILQSGKTIHADMVILSIGIRPNSKLAQNAGLQINERGGIVVDEYLRTFHDKNIYAIGDVIEVTEFISKNKTMIPLAGPANKQGRICANNICGAEEKYKGTQGTSIVKVFDLSVATTGINEKILKRLGMKYKKDYLTALIYTKSHAEYYPGANPMAIKVIFNHYGNILGAQIIGQDGVDKRIDVIAASVRLGGTVYDLKELELAYAPPYSSAKDPVNMIGFVGENILKGLTDVVHWKSIEQFKREGYLLDVRDIDEYLDGHIEGAEHIPLNDLRSNLDNIPKDKKIIVYCKGGLRGYIAERYLKQNGFNDVSNISGGYVFHNYKLFSDDI
ncbi:MAG: FAD-dependent oxidoreductase, partial [Clostridia bacterium]|nr:FAD-dependent oxidoreductase [Clostridia bacterium]